MHPFSKASEVAGAEWEPVKFWECSAPFINEVCANLLCCEAQHAHQDTIGASELQTSVVKPMAGMSQARGSWTSHIGVISCDVFSYPFSLGTVGGFVI